MAQSRDKKSGARLSQARLLSSLLLVLTLALSCLAALLFISKSEGAAFGGNTTLKEIGAAVYIALLFLLFGGYMAFQQRRIFRDVKLMTIVAIFVAIMPWLQLVCNMLNVHITPMLFAVMLVAELVDHRMGIATAVLLAAESALFAAGDELFSTVSLVMCAANVASGIAAVFALKKTSNRSGGGGRRCRCADNGGNIPYPGGGRKGRAYRKRMRTVFRPFCGLIGYRLPYHMGAPL